MDDLTDFLENGLDDPAFVNHDPGSPTKMFELGPTDVLYSVIGPIAPRWVRSTAGPPAVDRRTTTTRSRAVTWNSGS